MDQELLIAQRDYKELLDAISNPSEPNEALRKAMQDAREKVRDGVSPEETKDLIRMLKSRKAEPPL